MYFLWRWFLASYYITALHMYKWKALSNYHIIQLLEQFLLQDLIHSIRKHTVSFKFVIDVIQSKPAVYKVIVLTRSIPWFLQLHRCIAEQTRYLTKLTKACHAVKQIKMRIRSSVFAWYNLISSKPFFAKGASDGIIFNNPRCVF